MGEIDVAGSALNLANTGVVGSFLVLVIAALVALWLAYRGEVKDNKDMNKTMVEIATRLSKLVEDTYSIVKILPNEVRDKLKPDIDSLQKTVDQIYAKQPK
jgi:hypothetical protein